MNFRTERDEAFGRRYVVRNAIKMVPAGVGLFFLWRSFSGGQMNGFAFWFGIISFLSGIALWAWEDRLLFKNYHCPRCGTHIPKPKIELPGEGDPVIFVCEHCQIEWDTTLRT